MLLGKEGCRVSSTAKLFDKAPAQALTFCVPRVQVFPVDKLRTCRLVLYCLEFLCARFRTGGSRPVGQHAHPIPNMVVQATIGCRKAAFEHLEDGHEGSV